MWNTTTAPSSALRALMPSRSWRNSNTSILTQLRSMATIAPQDRHADSSFCAVRSARTGYGSSSEGEAPRSSPAQSMQKEIGCQDSASPISVPAAKLAGG